MDETNNTIENLSSGVVESSSAVADYLVSSSDRFLKQAIDLLPNVVAALLLALLTYVIVRLVGKAIRRAVKRTGAGAIETRLIVFGARSVVVVLGTVAILGVFGLGGLATGMLAGGGVTAVILGFAFRELGENLIAGVMLAFGRPFELGDLIQSGEFQGLVREVTLKYTHIRTEDGRDIFIPNAQILTAPLVNFTLDGLRRFSFTIGVDYRDEVDKACKLAISAMKSVKGVLSEPSPKAIADEFSDAWITITGSYWIDTAKQDSPFWIRTSIFEAVRTALAENGFTISADTVTNLAVKTRSDQS